MGKLLAGPMDLSTALDEVVHEGAAQVIGALSAAAPTALLTEFEGRPFMELPSEIGPVRQQVEAVELRDPLSGYPIVEQLRGELVATLRPRSRSAPPIATWWPNDVSIQRYWPSADVGITPHRDGKRYALLVAIFTVAGRARFSVHADRSSDAVRSWIVAPGDLTLLRAPGLAGPDGRLFHSVSGPLDGLPRYSLGFRMAASPTS